jgi:hypothetical protein
MKKKLFTTAVAVALVPALTFGAAACSGAEKASADTVIAQTIDNGSSNATGATTVSSGSAGNSTTAGSTGTTSGIAVAVAAEALTSSYDSEDVDATWDAAGAYVVTLNGDSISLAGTGATVDGSTVTITQPGTYVISGTLNDGQILVDTSVGGNVRLVLNGADINCSSSAPIYVKNADKATITLAQGTENKVTDGSSYTPEDSQSNEPNAAVFSKDDLTINGSGFLTVEGNYKNGIGTTNDLKITGGTITVDAAKDAIQGKDSIGVKAGAITVNAGGNGFQSNNDTESTKGYIAIEGGTFKITAGADALQAVTTLAVAGGDFTISTGGGSSNGKQHGQGSARGNNASGTSGSAADSAKGLKANGGVFVTGGTFVIDSADDSIHSNGIVKITAGMFDIKSGDDGIHADAAIQIDGGEIAISQCYEGIEAAVETINGGTIRLTSSDDGINVAGGNDSSANNNDPFAANMNNQLYINGGYLAIDAGGDGLDCNGSVYITNGTIVVNGPTNNGNGAIDYNGDCRVTGGSLVAVGSSGMAEVPDSSSAICSIMVNFDSVQQAGTLVHIESADGEEIVTVAPSKQFQSIVVTSAAIKQGSSYKVYLGGSSTGTVKDTVYTGGKYTPGTEYVSLDVEGVVTTYGRSGGFGGRQGGGGKRPGNPSGGNGQ